LRDMLTPRSACMAGALSSRLYVAGGFDGVEGVDVCESFDPATGLWEKKAPMISWRIGGVGAVADGKFYVLAGKNGGDNSLSCEAFCPITNCWSSLPAMPERHVYCAGAAVAG